MRARRRRSNSQSLLSTHPRKSKRPLTNRRLQRSLRLLVPVWGSTVMEHAVFGELKMPAVVFDWILGGLIPAALLTTAAVADLEPGTRDALNYTAIGLYGGTRIGILYIANDHISVHNEHLDARLKGVVVGGSF